MAHETREEMRFLRRACLAILAFPPRIERGTCGLEIRCSIQLSYGNELQFLDYGRSPTDSQDPQSSFPWRISTQQMKSILLLIFLIISLLWCMLRQDDTVGAVDYPAPFAVPEGFYRR